MATSIRPFAQEIICEKSGGHGRTPQTHAYLQKAIGGIVCPFCYEKWPESYVISDEDEDPFTTPNPPSRPDYPRRQAQTITTSQHGSFQQHPYESSGFTSSSSSNREPFAPAYPTRPLVNTSQRDRTSNLKSKIRENTVRSGKTLSNRIALRQPTAQPEDPDEINVFVYIWVIWREEFRGLLISKTQKIIQRSHLPPFRYTDLQYMSEHEWVFSHVRENFKKGDSYQMFKEEWDYELCSHCTVAEGRVSLPSTGPGPRTVGDLFNPKLRHIWKQGKGNEIPIHLCFFYPVDNIAEGEPEEHSQSRTSQTPQPAIKMEKNVLSKLRLRTKKDIPERHTQSPTPTTEQSDEEDQSPPPLSDLLDMDEELPRTDDQASMSHEEQRAQDLAEIHDGQPPAHSTRFRKKRKISSR